MHMKHSPVQRALRHFAFTVITLAAVSVQAAPSANLQLAQREMSLSEAAGQAQRQFGGEVIKAAPVQIQGRKAYRIRMVRPDGRVREMTLDATNGRPLGKKRK